MESNGKALISIVIPVVIRAIGKYLREIKKRCFENYCKHYIHTWIEFFTIWVCSPFFHILNDTWDISGFLHLLDSGVADD
jgi:L-asparagine transporter-like permease